MNAFPLNFGVETCDAEVLLRAPLGPAYEGEMFWPAARVQAELELVLLPEIC
jgi:hypothetical protein